MTTIARNTRKNANDITAYMLSLSFAIVIIRKSTLIHLKKLPIIDLVEDTISSTETLSFPFSTLFGETHEICYEGNNARHLHRILR